VSMDTGFEGFAGRVSSFREPSSTVLGKIQSFCPSFYNSLTSGDRELVLSSVWLKQVIVDVGSPPLTVNGLSGDTDDSVGGSDSQTTSQTDIRVLEPVVHSNRQVLSVDKLTDQNPYHEPSSPDVASHNPGI
jgi:hypothetical protein